MDARAFRKQVLLVVSAYILLLLLGVALRLTFPAKESLPYSTFNDLMPLAIAIPAAWLGYCVQRRQAYLKDVRELWSKVLGAVQDAIQYTHLVNPPQTEFAKVQRSLSIAVDEVRAVFANIGEGEGKIGLYPFEGLREIQDATSSFGFGEAADAARGAATRKEITRKWKEVRRHFLAECARGYPLNPHSPYLTK